MSALRRNAALALAVGALLVGRGFVSARSALADGRAALQRGDTDAGVRQLRRAAQWYLPGNPFAHEALEALEAHARACEARGQHAQALDAWRALRAALWSTRGLIPRDAARLDRANHHIAHRMSLLPPGPDERDAGPRAREERHLALLQEDRGADPAWTLVMGVGLAGLLAAAMTAALRGWDGAHRPQRAVLGRAAAAAAVGVGLFALGLWRA